MESVHSAVVSLTADHPAAGPSDNVAPAAFVPPDSGEFDSENPVAPGQEVDSDRSGPFATDLVVAVVTGWAGKAHSHFGPTGTADFWRTPEASVRSADVSRDRT